MSTYEKIIAAIAATLVIVMLVFSYHEITEPKGSDHEEGPNFAQSVGQDFKMGTFTTVLSQESSGAFETNCTALEPVIIGALHDIDQHLEAQGVYRPGTFEVNQQTLNMLCYQNASLTLSNDAGAKLLLVKLPFERKVPRGGGQEDVGTAIRINATVVLPGAVPPASPTTYGEELIPDRYLDTQHQNQR